MLFFCLLKYPQVKSSYVFPTLSCHCYGCMAQLWKICVVSYKKDRLGIRSALDRGQSGNNSQSKNQYYHIMVSSS